MPMRPKQRIALSSEARWRKKVKTWPNMSTRRADSSSDSTSNEEEYSDGPSREASEAAGWHPKTWLEDDVKPNQEELSEALNAGIRAPPEKEDSITVVLKSKVGKAAICLSSDSAKAGNSMQGLHDGPVGSATSSRDINNTGCEKPARKSFDCTACGKKIFSVWEIQEHPDLGVGICRTCYNFLFSSPYTKDTIDCSEEQCRWCGQGGRIVMCDRCDKSFCETCIIRNYGPKDLALIVSSNWSCFCCDPELLRVPIDELKEFQFPVLQHSETNNFPFKRKGASWAGQLITRDASEDIILGTEGEGATIAELLAQEEERRKQSKGIWNNSVRVKSTALKAGRKKKKATSTFDPEVHTKVRHPGTTEVKQKPELAIDKQAPASATPARAWIRPHQWVQKRQEAAERRKRAEAERLKNVTNLPNDGPKHTNSNTPEHLPHNIHCNEEDAYQKLPSEVAHSQVKSVGLSDALVGNESEVKKMV